MSMRIWVSAEAADAENNRRNCDDYQDSEKFQQKVISG